MSEFWATIQNATFDNEASVELRLIIPLLKALGYEDHDIAPKYPVIFQQGRKGRKPEVDFVVFHGPLQSKGTSLISIEAKKPGESFDDAKSQGESYAFNIRTPLLLITDAVYLEVWQLQPSQESECIVRTPVASLLSVRGRIEACLGKKAVIEYCKTLAIKNIITASTDFGSYETSELLRTIRFQNTIERTLTLESDAQAAPYSSDQLLRCFPKGCIVTSPSGFGKTTLAHALLRQAIDTRWKDNNSKLPFDLPLPDVIETGNSVIEFMQHRLSAHCPGISLTSLQDLLRETGALLICDGFDRLKASAQKNIEAALRNLTRDYPHIQLVIFSRRTSKPSLPLPNLSLAPLSAEQQIEFAGTFTDSNAFEKHSIISMMPKLLRDICEHPLLLKLTLEYWKREDKYPKKIDELFQSWLDVLLLSNDGDSTVSINRQLALSLLAKATTETSIGKVQALSLLKAQDIPIAIFDELHRCDAINISGTSVELQHEGLADYLRVLDLVSQDAAVIHENLKTVALANDSLFPVLLIALLPSHELHQLLWTRLSRLGLPMYLDALRYRRDVSGDIISAQPSEASYQYLQDLLEGVELPLNSFFPQISTQVTSSLANCSCDSLAITGHIDIKPSQINYAFLSSEEASGRKITIGYPFIESRHHYVNLELSRYRLDSGRLLGAMRLRDEIFRVIDERRLNGGKAWAAERLMGRLRYLITEYSHPIQLADTLDTIKNSLAPHKGQYALPNGYAKTPIFPIEELLNDINILESNKITSLDTWWIRLGWRHPTSELSNEVIQNLLNEHYRRVMQVYVELVENNFAMHASSFAFYSALPVKWNLSVVRESPPNSHWVTVYHQWMPVSSWNEVTIDVEFTNNPRNPLTSDFSIVRNELSRLNRPNNLSVTLGGFKQMPLFNGEHPLGRFDGETSVVRSACELITHDIKQLFSSLPSQD